MKRIYSPDSECSVADCINYPRSRGLCGPHSQRLKRHGSVQEHKPLRPYGSICRVDDCEIPVKARNLCPTHYEHERRTGFPTGDLTKSERGYAAPTTGRSGRFANVPEKEYKLSPQGYMYRSWGGRTELEHRVVWERAHGPLLRGQNVHHKNGDRTDNRLENLEIWDTTQPVGQRVEDKVEYALHILNVYAPDLLAHPAVT